MARTSQFQLVDTSVFAGKFAGKLQAWRQAGMSFESIARKLHEDYSVAVSGETVRRWYAQLPESERQAS